MTQRWPAALVLENGRIFKGEGFGAKAESIGEVVFNTSITGYQEIISDPSYCGQIVEMTATQIGNVGVNRLDAEARRVVCAGFAIRELSPIPASWRAEADLPGWLATSARRGSTCSGVIPIMNTLGMPGGAVSTMSATSECWTRYPVRVNMTPNPSATRMACAWLPCR